MDRDRGREGVDILKRTGVVKTKVDDRSYSNTYLDYVSEVCQEVYMILQNF